MARKSGEKKPADAAEAELVAVSKPRTMLRSQPSGLRSMAGLATDKADKKLKKYEAVMRPLFGASEERVAASMAALSPGEGAPLEDLSLYYRVEAPGKNLEKLQKDLLDEDLFDAVYIKPPVDIPQRSVEAINAMVAAPDEPPSATPDFSARQLYLDPAPVGVDARWAALQPGGSGEGIRIIDIEGGWRFSHEDLLQRQGGIVGGPSFETDRWQNHGTAVLGEYGGDVNGFGVVGISPDAICSAVSHRTRGSAGAINYAAGRLRAGDLLLLEMHRPGPLHNFQLRNDQRGYIAVEWWPDDFAAILNASRRGIIVVEAAGNGAENLDDPLYDRRPLGFPADWTNPFKRSNRDSGAVVVGAGAPPPGTHGRDHGPDRSRLGFSNYGALVDAQGWGREVTTCGYGDLQGGNDRDLWYTDTFSGTSSASPIVTGALACIQGMAKARNRPVFSPAQLREALRTTGSPQQDAPGRPRGQRIGNRPDIPALSQVLFGSTGQTRSVAFRREVERWRPLEMRAFIDMGPQLNCDFSTGELQQSLVSAQLLTTGSSGDLAHLAIMFRVSTMAGQTIAIAGPVGGGRYRWWGSIAGGGPVRLLIDEGFSSTGHANFDLVAAVGGGEIRFAFDGTTQRYRQV